MKILPPFEIIGRSAFVYRNLNAAKALGNVVYSVRTKGIVCLHTPCVQINEVEFRSSKGSSSTYGWEAVRKSGRKNVHAGIYGTIAATATIEGLDEIMTNEDWQLVGYDPRRDQSFMLLERTTREPICAIASAKSAICWSEFRDNRWKSLVLALDAK